MLKAANGAVPFKPHFRLAALKLKAKGIVHTKTLLHHLLF
jgi:hypothetical protein